MPQVRNAFLYQDVPLLPQIATAAVIDFGSDSANVRAAISLLSDELPADIPLPADVQILISKLFARAVSFPTLANVMTVDRLLSGGCRTVLAVLPHETLKRFEAQIFTILKDATDVEQQTVGLHCLSIMASFVRVRASRDRNSSTGAAVMSFFAGSKAAKTMQLTALQVVWACGSAGAKVPLKAVGCLRAAVNAISAIDVPLRHEWCSKNARILQKLMEKVTAAISDPAICLEVSNKFGTRSWLSVSDKITGSVVRCDADAARAHAQCSPRDSDKDIVQHHYRQPTNVTSRADASHMLRSNAITHQSEIAGIHHWPRHSDINISWQ